MWYDVPGRDEAWRKDTLSAMNFDTEKFDQEYAVEFQGSSGTLIAGWKLKELVHQVPIHKKDGLHLFEQPVKDHPYVCIVDVSRRAEVISLSMLSATRLNDCISRIERKLATLNSINMASPSLNIKF